MTSYFEQTDRLLDYIDGSASLTLMEEEIINEASEQAAAYQCHNEVQQAIVDLALKELEAGRRRINAGQALKVIALASYRKTLPRQPYQS